MKTVPPPQRLGPNGRKLWIEVVAKYELRQDELETLKAACGEADLIEKMNAALEDEPLLVKGSMGQLVTHPLVQELRQHRITMASLLRGLKLPDDQPSGTGINHQRAGGQARWAQAHGR